MIEPLIETWALYSVGSFIILMRIISRWRMIGIENFKPDDYLIVPAWVSLCGEPGTRPSGRTDAEPNRLHTRS